MAAARKGVERSRAPLTAGGAGADAILVADAHRTCLAALAAVTAGALLGGLPGLGAVASERHLAGRTLAPPPAASLAQHGASRACPGAHLRPNAVDIERVRAATLCLVNRERAAHGQRALRVDARLQRAAQAHTNSMVARDYFAHDGPGGQTPRLRMRAAGYLYSESIGYEVGENIAWATGRRATPRAIVAAWMGSPAHRANILDPRYRDTAIGVSPYPPSSLAHGRRGGLYTQDFGVIIPVRAARPSS